MRGRTVGRPEQDRWERKDWWGVVLDAVDAEGLLRFYSQLLGAAVYRSDETGGALDFGEGVAYLAVQANPDYVRPTWPAPPGAQQMMLHLDVEVDSLEEAVAAAIELGATLADHQPQDDVRVMLDPEGHPFCLYA